MQGWGVKTAGVRYWGVQGRTHNVHIGAGHTWPHSTRWPGPGPWGIWHTGSLTKQVRCTSGGCPPLQEPGTGGKWQSTGLCGDRTPLGLHLPAVALRPPGTAPPGREQALGSDSRSLAAPRSPVPARDKARSCSWRGLQGLPEERQSCLGAASPPGAPRGRAWVPYLGHCLVCGERRSLELQGGQGRLPQGLSAGTSLAVPVALSPFSFPNSESCL